MKSIDQIRMGITRFYDMEIRAALPPTKGVVYGMIIAAALARPEKWMNRIAPGAQMLSIMDEEGRIDIETLAEWAKEQMKAGGGKIEFEIGINPFNVADKDRFVFTAADVDRMLACISEY